MLDPWSFESICQEFPIFPTVVLFCLRATSRLSCFVSPCPDPQAFLSGCLGSLFGLKNFFPSIYAFPPPGLMLFLFKRIVRFRGAILLIVPLNLNSTWILILAFPGGSLSLPVCAFRDSCQADTGISSSASFLPFAPLVLGVRGPSSSVCLSYEVPVLNPAGSSRVSPVRSDLPFEGFSSQRDPGIPRSRWGIWSCFLKVSFYSGLCWSISRTSLCFLISLFSQAFCFDGRPESEWLWWGCGFLASKSLKPGTCRPFRRGWGKSLGEHISVDKLRHEDVSTSSFGIFRYRVLVEILAASTVFISTTLALSQQIFVFSLLGCWWEYLDILAAAKDKTWQEGYLCLSEMVSSGFAGSLE